MVISRRIRSTLRDGFGRDAFSNSLTHLRCAFASFQRPDPQTVATENENEATAKLDVPESTPSDTGSVLVRESGAAEPVSAWRSVEAAQKLRSGQGFISGRGRNGDDIPIDALRASRAPQSAFRVTGLAYHAWEYKLKEQPLPPMPALETLRQHNSMDATAVNPDVLSVVSDLETLSGAFLSMYSRHGSREDAQRVLQTRALPWLKSISAKLQNGSYVFPGVAQLEPQNLNQPKHDGTLHQIPLWWHKTVPEAMRLVLEGVFEPAFLRSAHGFRPDKGCYTALKEVKYGFAGVDYLLVGDLSSCVESFDKSILLDAIKARIPDDAFLKLVGEAVRHEYVDLSVVSFKNIGLPQPTLLSPILCNIYLHEMDRWLDQLAKCLSVGGQVEDETESAYGAMENRRRYGSRFLTDTKSWRSPSLTAVRYVRYGNNLLIGVQGMDTDMEQLELDLVKFIQSKLHLNYKRFHYNRVLASSPEKAYVVFLGAEVYVAPQISSPGLKPGSHEAGQLPNRPRLCVPARLLLKKLEESGFVDAERKRPRYCRRLVLWECHEIVKYYDIVIKLFCMYYTFADNYHCLLLLYDILKQSCALTLARKLGLKRMWHVHKRLERDLIVRDMEGVPLASFERPRFNRPLDPFIGRDINPFIRIERPSRPKFPPIKLGESFHEPHFPLSKIERSVLSRSVLQGQS